MAWIYDVKRREFSRNGQFKFRARYAGNGKYKDDPLFECVKNKGPLPRGKYRIVGKPFRHARTGADTLRLMPDVSNTMCNRAGFLIHGESKTNPGRASNGCIILDRDYRLQLADSQDRELIVL